MYTRKNFLGLMSGAALAVVTAGAAVAQEVTLKLEHFLPAGANVPVEILDVWANNLERNSNGRIKIERYATMSLGGTPPELIDHVQDGIVDIGWVVVGYTPGRYPTTEVFELPFMVEDADAASYAFWKMHERHMKDGETKDLKMLGTWVHGPGMFHTADPVETPADLEGMKIRGGSRLVNDLLTRVGATPVGMPVPAVAEALSKWRKRPAQQMVGSECQACRQQQVLRLKTRLHSHNASFQAGPHDSSWRQLQEMIRRSPQIQHMRQRRPWQHHPCDGPTTPLPL